MKNYVQPGDTLTLTAPSGGVVGGTPYLIGELFGVAAGDADEGAKFDLSRAGVFTMPKTTGTGWSEGDPLYWDNTTKKLTTAAGDNRKVAVAVATAGSGAALGDAVIVPDVTVTPSTAITDPTDISGGEVPTEAEHNAALGKIRSILSALRARNVIAD